MILASIALVAGCGTTETAVAPDVTMAPAANVDEASALATTGPHHNRGNGALGTVYVTSQGLYYDTFVAVQTLPPKGRFQLLENGKTQYGPGDPGYLGGRWKVPKEEGGYDYFLCPLLPPGRETPE